MSRIDINKKIDELGLYEKAKKVVLKEKRISGPLLQHKLDISWSTASNIINKMEEEGFVSKPDGMLERKILKQ